MMTIDKFLHTFLTYVERGAVALERTADALEYLREDILDVKEARKSLEMSEEDKTIGVSW